MFISLKYTKGHSIIVYTPAGTFEQNPPAHGITMVRGAVDMVPSGLLAA